MFIMQIVKIRLNPTTQQLKSEEFCARVNEWLSHWTCINNFECCIEYTYEEALVHCRQTLRDRLIPSWLTGAEIDDFEFMISYQEVKNNEFWLNASCPLCHWYKINPNE